MYGIKCAGFKPDDFVNGLRSPLTVADLVPTQSTISMLLQEIDDLKNEIEELKLEAKRWQE